MWYLIPILAVLFILVHLAKMARLYLVLMEHKINLRSFVLLYCKTTFINLIIPFKIGELYRIYKIKKETKLWQVGVLSVVIDRFFDILALFLILLPVDIYYKTQISSVTGFFFVLLALITIVYMVVLPTYKYLNKYIIMHKQSNRSMLALKGLEYAKEWYDFSTNLIRGRFALITLSSLVGWISEVFLLKAFAMFLANMGQMTETFGIKNFPDYVASIFLGGGNSLTTKYTYGTALIFLVLSIIVIVATWIRREPKSTVDK